VAGDILDFGSGYVDWLSNEEERRGQADAAVPDSRTIRARRKRDMRMGMTS
jgi:hypothetical protein